MLKTITGIEIVSIIEICSVEISPHYYFGCCFIVKGQGKPKIKLSMHWHFSDIKTKCIDNRPNNLHFILVLSYCRAFDASKVFFFSFAVIRLVNCFYLKHEVHNFNCGFNLTGIIMWRRIPRR